MAQQAPANPAVNVDPANPLGRDFVTQPYSPARLARTAALAGQAWQLLDYCNDPGISDAVLTERLQRFAQITGREEDCRSLRDYWPLLSGNADAAGP